jgi:hypothetical protein
MMTDRRTLLHKTAVSHSLAKGGEADGKRALDESPALCGVAGGGFFPLQKTVSTKNFPRGLTSCINCIIIANTIVQSHKEENFSETVKNSLRLFRNILEK